VSQRLRAHAACRQVLEEDASAVRFASPSRARGASPLRLGAWQLGRLGTTARQATLRASEVSSTAQKSSTSRTATMQAISISGVSHRTLSRADIVRTWQPDSTSSPTELARTKPGLSCSITSTTSQMPLAAPETRRGGSVRAPPGAGSRDCARSAQRVARLAPAAGPLACQAAHVGAVDTGAAHGGAAGQLH